MNNSDVTCKNLPNTLSSFIDTFVDFSVAGIFLPDPPSPPFSQTTYPPPDRLIAVGDLHGDLFKSKQALRLAGLIDADDRWSGGSSVLVQVGDVLDRGGQEIKILYFLEKLKRQAVKDGGNVITMNGNHEIMNLDGNFFCTFPSGFEEFKNWAYWYTTGNNMKQLCDGLTKPKDLYSGIPLNFRGVKQEYVDGFRARIAALRPTGPIATRFLSKNLTAVVVGESVFVHGGILREHIEYGLEQINNDVRDWITGLKDSVSSDLVRGRNSVVWNRKFSNKAVEDCDCSMLEHALATIPGARRMIMGHTIQTGGINAVCDGKAVRIDVGMSQGCINGLPEVLEITGNSHLQILTSKPVYDSGRQDLVVPEELKVLEVQVKA
ncbi:hypothetical protein R6Q59_026500 [Mikania micrantha]|uniref:Calcineurin-like phosphoesterase domain-containing protein n=1 Tax=Mikania micrantha TaxID=192012 RepID=A0A5N6PZV5_9ASTR|nr:hypothetical protein E3N88_01041 [Mikania micrantha]